MNEPEDKRIDGLVVFTSEGREVYAGGSDESDDWWEQLRRCNTDRLERLWAEPPLTEAEYHQSMITDD